MQEYMSKKLHKALESSKNHKLSSRRTISVPESLEFKIRLVLNMQPSKTLKSMFCKQIYVGTLFFSMQSPLKSVEF